MPSEGHRILHRREAGRRHALRCHRSSGGTRAAQRARGGRGAWFAMGWCRPSALGSRRASPSPRATGVERGALRERARCRPRGRAHRGDAALLPPHGVRGRRERSHPRRRRLPPRDGDDPRRRHFGRRDGRRARAHAHIPAHLRARPLALPAPGRTATST